MDPRRRALLEITAVIVSATVFFVGNEVLFVNRFALILSVCLPWVGYIAWRLVSRQVRFPDWGVRTDNLRAALKPCAFLVGIGSVSMFAFRLTAGDRGIQAATGVVPHGELALPVHALAVFGLYTLWGIVQQLLAQGFVTDNLRRLGLRTALVIPIVAVLFGLAHYPRWDVVALTMPACAIWTYLYIQRPNVIVLGVSHAVLGTLAYYWVFQRDPWLEIFAQ